MAKMSGNVFGQAAANRKAEQENIEQTIKSGEQSSGRGRPPKTGAEKTITVSVRMTEETKMKLKVYAAKHGVTVSDLIKDYADGLDAE